MKKTAYLFILLSLLSCKKCKELPDDDLCSSRTWNNSTLLRTDGYYYFEYNNHSYRDIVFLYQNGIFIDDGISGSENFDDEQQYLSDNSFYANYQNNKLKWGIYSIQDSSIVTERWYPSEDYFPVYSRIGKIVNDSTFSVTQSFRCDGSDSQSENAIYHFKKFSPKPDSTNTFIN